MHTAAQHDHERVGDLLIEMGLDIESEAMMGETPLHVSSCCSVLVCTVKEQIFAHARQVFNSCHLTQGIRRYVRSTVASE